LRCISAESDEIVLSFGHLKAAVVLLLCGLAGAQSPPVFEVVSIKPAPPGTMMELIRSGRIHEKIDDAQVDAGGESLRDLILLSWSLPEDQISGPDWISSVRFDVHAKLPAGASRKDVPAMMQAMLAERFGLKIHHEERVKPVYALIPGKGPLKLKVSDPNDTSAPGCNGGPAGGQVCRHTTMADLAVLLTNSATMRERMPSMTWGLDRPAIDMTGLTGSYDFTMRYGVLGGRSGNAEPGPEMSIADAVKDLGLKLEPVKHSFDIVVIDHIERAPTGT
jgi:uncharacterized protein (TIGR03435 family)